jgi:divalent metal cation (Fe/Co/Zn/Cd) transporter
MQKSDALLSLSNSKRAIWASIAGGTIVFAGKLCVVMYCGGMGEASDSIVAETAHSFVDVMNQMFLLVGIHRSQRPICATHPRGMAARAAPLRALSGYRLLCRCPEMVDTFVNTCCCFMFAWVHC